MAASLHRGHSGHQRVRGVWRDRPGQRARSARLLRSWITPAAAAAVIVALAITLVTVRDIPNGRQVHRATPMPAIGGIPRYYVAVSNLPGTQGLVVRETRTGAALATITPPRGSTFVSVTGAEDGKTFVAEAEPVTHNRGPAPASSSSVAVTWYLLRIKPGGRLAYRLMRLALPDMRPWLVQEIALSASGRDLAMELIPAGLRGDFTLALRVYSVATGKLLRGWSTGNLTAFGLRNVSALGIRPAELSLSWTDGDRALAFMVAVDSVSVPYEERLLDLTMPPGDLIADSRLLWLMPFAGGGKAGCGPPDATAPPPTSLLVTADGKTVLCTRSTPFLIHDQAPVRVTVRWLAYSVATKTVRIRYQVKFDALSSVVTSGVLWADPSGDTMIISWQTATDSQHMGVVSRGRFIPLPPLAAATIGAPAW